MKVLFVSSGNSSFGVSPIIKNQGSSLEKFGIEVQYYLLNGKGFLGYLKSVIPLRKYLQNNKFDVIHAHFSLSCFVAAISGAKPLVASLMGWNVKLLRYKIPIYIFNALFFDACIVKSKGMANSLGLIETNIIPNGVDTKCFYPLDKRTAQSILGWDHHEKHILFAADPKRPIKNFPLACEAFDLVVKSDDNIRLHFLDNIPNEQMVFYYNACDVVLLTSKAEGSPNVIKEAMACNAVIVSTDVGDVSELFENVSNCFIANDNADDIAKTIVKALDVQKCNNAREKIMDYDSEVIAKRVISVYNSVFQHEPL